MNVGVDDKGTSKKDGLLDFTRRTVPSLSWPDYQAKILPFGQRNTDDTKRINREWRRWRLADKDGNNRLTKQEFKVSQ